MTSNKLPAIFDRSPFESFFKHSIGMDDFFDRIFDDFLPTVSSVSYPPYNIRKDGDDVRVIELALAGYSENDIDITLEDNVLVIRGGKKVSDIDDNSGNYLYRGVAARKFERRFQLADGAEVLDAAFKDGMLSVSIKVHVPEKAEPKRIPINAGLLTDESKSDDS